MRLPRLVAGGAIVAVLTGTAACGLGSVEPKLQLRDAARVFAAGDTGVIRLSIPSSVDQVKAFAKAADPSAAADESIPDSDLQTMLSSSIDLGYDYGSDPKSDKDDAGRMVVHIGDLDAGEIRSVDQMMYVKVDVDGLVQEFPDMQDGVDGFRASLTGADGSGEAVPPSLAEPAAALLDGKWVSLDYQAMLDQIDKVAAAAAADPSADPSAAPDAGVGLADDITAQLRDLAGKALSKAVVSVERRETDDRLGDHLVATVSLRKAYAGLRPGLPKLFTGLTDQMEQELPAVDEVPDATIAVSFWVLDDKLTRVELDAAQFLDKPTGHLVLRADLLDAEKITAPTDAVKFDVEGLMAGLPTGLSGAPEGAMEGGIGDMNAHTVANYVDMDIVGTAAAEGAAPSVDYLPKVLPDFMDMAPGLLIVPVGPNIQVNLNGESACLTLSPDGSSQGTIVDAPC